jgi:hypothetical protein
LLTTGFGFTVTVTVNVPPLQGPIGDKGETVYEKVIGASVVFDNTPLLNDVALEPDIVPTIPETEGADQV